MRVVRLLLAGLIALTALAAGLFAAVLLFFVGLVGFVASRFRPSVKPRVKPSAGPTPASAAPGGPRRSALSDDDVIDVVATKVPGERTGE